MRGSDIGNVEHAGGGDAREVDRQRAAQEHGPARRRTHEQPRAEQAGARHEHDEGVAVHQRRDYAGEHVERAAAGARLPQQQKRAQEIERQERDAEAEHAILGVRPDDRHGQPERGAADRPAHRDTPEARQAVGAEEREAEPQRGHDRIGVRRMQPGRHEERGRPGAGEAESDRRRTRCAEVGCVNRQHRVVREGLCEAGGPHRVPERGYGEEWDRAVHGQHQCEHRQRRQPATGCHETPADRRPEGWPRR